MKKNLINIFLLFFLAGCLGLEPVYKSNENIFEKNIFQISVEKSQYGPMLSQILYERLGSPKNNLYKYKLKAKIKDTKKPIVYNKDGTASKFEIITEVTYSVFDIEQSCEIINYISKNKTVFNSKSEGYEYGSLISEKDAALESLSNGFDKFLKNLNLNLREGKCVAD